MRPIPNARQRIGLAVGLGVGLLVAAATVPAWAAPVPDGSYSGATTDGDSVAITMNSAGTAVSTFAVAPPPTQCPGRVEATNLEVGNNAFVGRAGVSGAPTIPLAYAGYVGDAGAIAGGFAVGGNIPGTTCPGPAGVFTATERSHQGARGIGGAPGATYRGSVRTFTGITGPRTVGTVTVTMGSDGKTIERLDVAVTSSGCSYPVTITNEQLTDGKVFRSSARPPLTSTGSIAVVGVVRDEWRLGGAIAYPAMGVFPTSYCASMTVEWSAEREGAPDTSGRFAAPPVFTASGQAFAVFLGGSVAQLRAAAATGGAGGAWVQDADGVYRLLVVDGPAFLGADFEARFPAGFTAATSVILTRA
ncbi:MAG: hypothetical protein AB7G21_04285 [Dehalococcoidia bacterium]